MTPLRSKAVPITQRRRVSSRSRRAFFADARSGSSDGDTVDRARVLSARRALLGVGLALLIGGRPEAFAQPPADRHTRILAQFNGQINADYAQGRDGPLARGAAPHFVAGRFGRAVELHEGQWLRYAGEANLHPAAGTIEFWFKPNWPGDDTQRHRLFSCIFGPRQYIHINTLGRGRLGFAMAAGEGEAWTWRRADIPIAHWKPGQWHHVACTWGGGKLQIYVDGKPGPEAISDATMPDHEPEELLLTGGDGAVDALRILDRPLTADEIAAEIELALSHPYRWLDEIPHRPDGAARSDGHRLLGDIRIPLVIGNRVFRKGLLCRVDSEIRFALDREYELLQATVGIDRLTLEDTVGGADCEAAVTFEIWGDGKRLHSETVELADSLKPTTDADDASTAGIRLQVPISGTTKLTLKTRPQGNVPPPCRCIWGGAVLKRTAEVDMQTGGPLLTGQQLAMYRRQLRADQFHFDWSIDKHYMVVPKYWEDDVEPAVPPSKPEQPVVLRALATPGEYEPVNFVVYAGADLGPTEVAISDLKANEATIAAENVEPRVVLRALMREVYTLPPERSRVVSRFLLPYRPVSIEAGTLREYHLTVRVPEDASPGEYRGTVEVRPKEGFPQRLPLVVNVLPIRLDEPKRPIYGMYYRFPSGDDWTGLDLEMADLRAHGVTTLKSNLGVQFTRGDDGVEVSLERLHRGLALMRKHGFHGPLPVFSGANKAARALEYDPVRDGNDPARKAEFERLVRRGLDRLAALGEQYPEFEFLPTHMDEVFGRDRLERYIALTQAVQQASPMRVYITLHNRPGSEPVMRKADPYIDVRCYNGHSMDDWLRAGHTFAELAAELEASGDEAWTYYNIRGAFFRPEWTRLVNGFYLWVSPLEGHVPWMYHYTFGNPLDDTDGPRQRGHDFVYALPDPKDPSRLISTRHWEGFREGVDDMRYLATLQRLVAEQPQRQAARAAARWLKAHRERLAPRPERLRKIEAESPVLIDWARAFDGEEYRRFRREAAEHFMRFEKER